MEFRVLGALEVSQGETPVPIVSAYKPRLVLAALLSRAEQLVSVDWLTRVVWADRPPASTPQNLRHYIHQLRAALGPGRIHTQTGGYLLHAGDGLDATRFRRLVAEGSAALREGDAVRAGDRLRVALDLWHGPAYSDFTDCAEIAEEAARLEELRLGAYERWAEARLALGDYGAPIAELMDLVRAHPYREALCGWLMRALYGAGRQADALELFHGTRSTLAEQLGIEPGPQLRDLHGRMLRGDPQLLARGDGVPLASAGGGVPPVPRELPADVPGFAGRSDALSALDALLDGERDGGGGPTVVCVVTGTAGVGKTALAVRWAHRVAGRFPDGQLYLNLLGYAPGRPLRPIEALTVLMGGLGVPAKQVPIDEAAASARYRSHLAGRRVLVVLDNAASAAQVRPLLAGGTGCFVLVTSRDRLTGLVAYEGARRIELDVMKTHESADLLADVLGRERVAAEPAATADLARICANLPLALRIAGASLVDQPHRTIAGYAADLAESSALAALAVDGDDDVSVRNAFELSYRALPEAAQRCFRYLGLVPCPDFSLDAVAALAAMAPSDARRTMDRLAAAHLVVQHKPGRYTTHDLLRQYAAHLTTVEDTAGERATAAKRLFDWFGSRSVGAARVLHPHVVCLPVPADFQNMWSGPDAAGRARDWIGTEWHNLATVILHAARHGPRDVAWRCADALRAFQDQGRHLAQWLAVSRAALAAARADDDPYAQAAAYHGLAHVHYYLGNYRRSLGYLRRTLTLAAKAGWDQLEAATSNNLAIALHMRGDTTGCIEHLRDALRIYERIDWSSGVARTMMTLANVYRETGRLHEGAELATREAFPRAHTAGPFSAAQATTVLGELYALLGRLDEALHLFHSALPTLHAYGNGRSEANCRVWTARALRDLGRLDEAREAAALARQLADDIGVPELQAAAHNALALVDEAGDDLAGARRHHETALAIARRIGAQHTVCEALLGLATAEHRRGESGTAERYATEAVTLAQQAGFAVVEGQALTLLGRLHHQLGDDATALDLAERALRNHQQTGHRLGEAHTHLVLAAILDAAPGDRSAGGAHREAARAIFEETGATPGPERVLNRGDVRPLYGG
ncbi:AfsR/SARP family transcriptional regulator [Phytohabitans suffuscus]